MSVSTAVEIKKKVKPLVWYDSGIRNIESEQKETFENTPQKPYKFTNTKNKSKSTQNSK